MRAFNRHLKFVLTASAAALFLTVPTVGRPDDSVTRLLDGLGQAEPAEAKQIERELELIWSRSGSSSMDLLLRKGRDALQGGDPQAAIGHLSALIDHAPDFAEGWHIRASAFYQLEEFGQAQSDLMQALALNPQHFQAAFGLAALMEQTGRIDAAYDGYRAVLSVYPAHEQAQAGRDRLAPLVSGSDT
ncbi:tetratricopeptide repeat protein [Ferrimonas balearica]|nr:tetratricopeptide repeat protein [Ferrimonas balearica]